MVNMIIFILLLFSSNAMSNHIIASETYASMALPNDENLRGAPSTPDWTRQATIVQGIPKGNAAPSYWSNGILDKTILTDEDWSAMTAWFTVFEGENNTVSDIRVKIEAPEVWVLRRSQINDDVNWTKLAVPEFNWAAYYTNDLISYVEDAPKIASINTGYSYITSTQHYPIHGGTERIKLGEQEVLAIFLRVKAHLEGDATTSIDDARYLLSIGADYYPTVNSSVSKGDFADVHYLPGAGGSRFSYLTKEPKWYFMATVSPDDLAIVDKSSDYFKEGGKTYLTREEWLHNPPHIENKD